MTDKQGKGEQEHDSNGKETDRIHRGRVLVIRVPLNPTPTRSATGKTLVVASSHGNKETEVQVQGKTVYVGVNAYIKP